MARPLLARFLCAALALGAAACERNSNLLREANEATSQEKPNYALAQKLLDQVIEQTASDTSASGLIERRSALLMRATNYRNMSLLSAAEADLRACISLDPNDVEALSDLAMVLVDRGDTKVENQQKTDFDLAIEYAGRALAIQPNHWTATTAAGRARLERGKRRREQLNAEILNYASGGDFDTLKAAIARATGLPARDPLSVSLERELERRLEIRGTDVRLRVMEGLASAREDTLEALRLLRMSLRLAPADFTGLTVHLLLQELLDLRHLEEAVVLSRLALKIPSYRESSWITDSVTHVFEEAGLEESVVSTILAYYDTKRPLPLETRVKRRALRCAEKTGDVAAMEKLVTRFKKTLGSDGDAAVLSRVLDYYDGILRFQKGEESPDVVRILGDIARRPDPAIAELIPKAVDFSARIVHKTIGIAAAKELVELGLAADKRSVPLLLYRARLNLEDKKKGDPFQAGQDLATIIALRPREVESFYPMLREAADVYVGRTGRTLKVLEEETVNQGKRLPGGFEEAWVYYAIARDFYESGKMREAASTALEALSHDAALAPAHTIVGLARAKLGELAEARQAFERLGDAIPSDPNFCRAIQNTGVAPMRLSLHWIAASPEVQGRIVVADSMLDRGDLEGAAKVLGPLALKPDAPVEAKVLLARLAYLSGIPDADSKLPVVDRGTRLGSLVEQARLHAAIARDDREAAAASAALLAKNPAFIDTKKLRAVVEASRGLGHAPAAVEAAKLLVDVSPKEGLASALELYAHTLLNANETKRAVEAFDRLVGMQLAPNACVWLGLALQRNGDRAGVLEALTMIRQEWAAAPFSYQRAVLAVLGGQDPTPEELSGVSMGVQDPLSVLAVAAMFVARFGKTPSASELPRLAPWVESAVDFVGVSKERAEAVLRLALALRTQGGGVDALAEIAAADLTRENQPFGTFLLASALSLGSPKSARALEEYEKAAHALPDLSTAWQRALDLALEIAPEQAPRIARDWLATRPNDPSSQLAALVASHRERLRRGEALDGLEKELAELAKNLPGDFEISLLLLKTRAKLGRRVDAMTTAREVAKLAIGDRARLERSMDSIVSAFATALPEGVNDARAIARQLASASTDSCRPIQLLVRCDLADERYQEAATFAVEYLRREDRLSRLSDEDISGFIDLLARTSPPEAARIAELSVGAEPGDVARWKTYARTLESMDRDADVLYFLRPFVGIEPRGLLRGTLAEILARAGNDPRAAVNLILGSAALRSPKWNEEQVAACHASALLGDGAAAVNFLDWSLGNDPNEKPCLENARAWRALSLAYAIRAQGNDTTTAVKIANELTQALGPDHPDRFAWTTDVFRAFNFNLRPTGEAASAPASLPAFGYESASRPASGPASRPESLPSSAPESGPASRPESLPESNPKPR